MALLIATGSNSGPPAAGPITSLLPVSPNANVSQDEAASAPVDPGEAQTPWVPKVLVATRAEPTVTAVAATPVAPPVAGSLIRTVMGANVRSPPSMSGTVVRQLPAQAALGVSGGEEARVSGGGRHPAA